MADFVIFWRCDCGGYVITSLKEAESREQGPDCPVCGEGPLRYASNAFRFGNEVCVGRKIDWKAQEYVSEKGAGVFIVEGFEPEQYVILPGPRS